MYCPTRLLNNFLLLTLALFAVRPAVAQRLSMPASNVSGLWHLDEGGGSTALDSSGNGNNGVITAASYTRGRFGTALSFDGASANVDFGNATSLQVSAGDFTVEAWVKFGALTNTGPCLGNSGCDMSIVDKMADTLTSDDNGWRLFKQSDNRFWFCIGQSFGVNSCLPAGGAAAHSTMAAIPGVWYHVAGVKTSNSISLYVNGALQQAVAVGPINDNNSVDLRVDSRVCAPCFLSRDFGFFNGQIDEVQVWNRALSSSEVLSSAQAGLRGLWHLDEAAGATAGDSSGYGNDGAVNGATFTASGGLTNFGNSLSLNGAGDFVDAGNASTLQVSHGDFTVETWVRFATLTNSSGPCYGPGCDVSIIDKMADTFNANDNGWRLIKQSDNRFWFCIGQFFGVNSCQPAGGAAAHSTMAALPGVWYHVAAVKTANAISLYVNGVLQETVTVGPINDNNAGDLRFGANATEGALLNGQLDEVHLWARALSAAEIAFLAGTATRAPLLIPDRMDQELAAGAVFSSRWQADSNTRAMALAFLAPDISGTAISSIAVKSESSPETDDAVLLGWQNGLDGLSALITGSPGSKPSKALHLHTTLSDGARLEMQLKWRSMSGQSLEPQ